MVSIAQSTSQQVKLTDNLINGKFVRANSHRTFKVYNPALGEPIAKVAESDTTDVDAAVAAAYDAFNNAWAKFSPRDRANVLYKFADLIEKNAEELATLETLNNGKPISETTLGDLPLTIATFRNYAGWADKIYGDVLPTASNDNFVYTRKEPVGVCGQIIPWNFPLVHISWKWGAALATGNTIVFKPAEQTPLTALRMGELALEAGIPPGVINIVNGFGDVGNAIVKHPNVDKISFTGHHKTAQSIMAAASQSLKRLTFELGGKSPNIVYADADLDAAVLGAIQGIFFNQGEVCCAGSRLFIEKSAHDEFVEKFKQKAESRIIGDPLDPKTEQGAQVSKEQYDKILNYINIGKKEATCYSGGEPASDTGWFIKPTIFTGVDNHMRIAQEEIFGPVVSVIPFEKHSDLIAQANDSPFGLAAAVWTRDISKAFKISQKIRAGTVWVNCYNTFDPSAPFGGFKLSGHGRDSGRDSLNSYMETKTVWINTNI